MLISAIIIARNEAASIRRCLSSLHTIADEIVVIDALSTDRTADIALEFTDKVFRQEWLGYCGQKEFAIAKTTHDWVLWIDADEELSPELRSEILALDDPPCSGLRIPRKTWYLGRWILHGGWYPDRVLRLFRKKDSRLDGNTVHESVIANGPVSDLIHPIHHYSYRNIAHHIEKMNAFTSLSAQQMLSRGKRVSALSPAIHAVGRFVRMYFLQRGLLDGVPGLHIAVLGAFYVFLKYAKLDELRRELRNNKAADAKVT